jgi:hypothetical protein
VTEENDLDLILYDLDDGQSNESRDSRLAFAVNQTQDVPLGSVVVFPAAIRFFLWTMALVFLTLFYCVKFLVVVFFTAHGFRIAHIDSSFVEIV